MEVGDERPERGGELEHLEEGTQKFRVDLPGI